MSNDQNRLAYEMLTAEFPDSQVKSFNGAKEGKPPRWLSYVPDETVMDRLDAIFFPGNWNVNVAPTPTPGVALVTLGLKWPDNDDWTYYSDFGYPTNGTAGEALKESAGDGIRRCARYAGIARYIYAGGQITTHAPEAQQQRPQAPRPQQEPEDFDMADVDGDGETICAKHNVNWYGTPADGRYHKNGTDPDSGKTIWCRHPLDDARRQQRGNRR